MSKKKGKQERKCKKIKVVIGHTMLSPVMTMIIFLVSNFPMRNLLPIESNQKRINLVLFFSNNLFSISKLTFPLIPAN